MINTDLINNYIDLCDIVITSNDIISARNLFLEIKSIFEFDIPHFMHGLKSDQNSASIDWELTNPYWLDDIPIIKAKLTKFLSENQNNTITQKTMPNITINNTNSNNATFNNSISIDILVNTARYNISEMSTLSDEETKLALEKVNELAEIIKSKENRKHKWSKIASVFKWIAEKSVDLACAFVPLIMQALQSL